MQESTKNKIENYEWLHSGNIIDITYYLSGRCNFDCKFCAFKEVRQTEDTTIERTKQIINDLEEIILQDQSKKYLLNFTGGEPTLDLNKLKTHYYLFKELRDKYPSSLRIGMYTNGYFANNEETLKEVLDMKFDSIVFSCSIDHFNNGNHEYLAKLLKSNYDEYTDYMFLFIDKWKIKETYLNKLRDNGISEDTIYKICHEQICHSKSCVNITNEDKLINYYKSCTMDVDMIYKPFGVFVINNAIYANCGSEGNMPWCKLSNNLKDALLQQSDMYMEVSQPCSEECLLTCKHIQKAGYNCFCKKKLKVNVSDKIVISESYFKK